MAIPKALVFAYACDPSRGSEPGAGAVLSEVIATICDQVVVISRREGGLDPIKLASSLGPNVRVIQVGLKSVRLPTYVRYFVWIILAARAARSLRRHHEFEVVHHATYGSDWFFNPLIFMKKKPGERWVWGPAGGSSYASLRVGRAVTKSWAWGEWTRSTVTRMIRVVVHRLLRRDVDVAVALNSDSAGTFRSSGFAQVVTQTNAVLPYDDMPLRAEGSVPKDSPVAVYASRGVAWKGLALALEAVAFMPPEWKLVVAGPGTDTPQYRELAATNADRISFVGTLDRRESLALLSNAAALLLPSLHDSAPWVAAEAAGIGIPVVCLDLGGVASMAGPLAVAVSPTPTKTLSQRFAFAVANAIEVDHGPYRIHTANQMRSALERVYRRDVPT